jgi:hypothetical protein
LEDQRQSDIVLVRLDEEDALLVASTALIVQGAMVERDIGINNHNIVNTGTSVSRCCQVCMK